jgi:ABC-type transport system substrate-binding protein
MARRLVVTGMLGAAALALSGCFASGERSVNNPAWSRLRGGTLRVGVDTPFGAEARPGSAKHALDPQFEYFPTYWELYRCCLLRTLLSYSGQSTGQGGATLRPDLAAALPRVSPDGLTWAFHLKHGLHYAPPFQAREIVAGDIVRALEREFRLGGNASYSFYYTVIEGANAFAAHRTDSIAGLEVPDPHTLVVHLTQPTGDLGYRFSLAATAPIPPGADRGHDRDYGRYLVSSGPYMIAGSERMNFALPPTRQPPASGWRYRYALRHGRFVTVGRETLLLVRNPSWDPRTDALRKAYPDRIELEMRGSRNSERYRNAREVDRGALDLVLDENALPGQIRRYEQSKRLLQRLHMNAATELDFIAMNLALPPFDDVHVRRALNLALDRRALAHTNGTELGPVTPTEHVLPDSVEDDLLASYGPYPLRGDLAAARAEMARSRYDRNHDGRCDAPACRGIVAYGRPLDLPHSPRAEALIRRDFARIGVVITDRHPRSNVIIPMFLRPRSHLALSLASGWAVDFPDAASFAPVLQKPSDATNLDFSLLGATPGQLRRWGYRVRSVPSVDTKIAQCRTLLGELRTRCWAELDQLLTERVVPWVPLDESEFAAVTSARVVRYSFDQFVAAPALDRLALGHAGG